MDKSYEDFINYIHKFKYCHWRGINEDDFILELLCNYPNYWKHILTYIFIYHGYSVKYSRINETKELFNIQKENRNIKLKCTYSQGNEYAINRQENNTDNYIVIFDTNGMESAVLLGDVWCYDIGPIIENIFTTKFKKIFKFMILKTCNLKYLCAKCIRKNIIFYKNSELKKMNRDIKKIFSYFNISEKYYLD